MNQSKAIPISVSSGLRLGFNWRTANGLCRRYHTT